MIRPLAIDMTRTPPISGVSRSPDSVGPTPSTVCMNSGRNVSAPNSASPTMKPTALVTPNTRLANRRGARIGSAARRSTQTDSTMSTTAATERPMMKLDVQAKVLPPRLVTSTTQVMASEITSAPT
jgi:hypothetical protein